jgi:hypothetical protein
MCHAAQAPRCESGEVWGAPCPAKCQARCSARTILCTNPRLDQPAHRVCQSVNFPVYEAECCSINPSCLHAIKGVRKPQFNRVSMVDRCVGLEVQCEPMMCCCGHELSHYEVQFPQMSPKLNPPCCPRTGEQPSRCDESQLCIGDSLLASSEHTAKVERPIPQMLCIHFEACMRRSTSVQA